LDQLYVNWAEAYNVRHYPSLFQIDNQIYNH
jgi:hypothetical protein